MASTSGDFGMAPPGASAQQPWKRPVTKKTITYVSVITFLAWVMSVYDYTLFGTLLPVLAKEFGWSTSGATAVNTFATIGVFVVPWSSARFSTR
jgi:MFS family permease